MVNKYLKGIAALVLAGSVLYNTPKTAKAEIDPSILAVATLISIANSSYTYNKNDRYTKNSIYNNNEKILQAETELSHTENETRRKYLTEEIDDLKKGKKIEKLICNLALYSTGSLFAFILYGHYRKWF